MKESDLFKGLDFGDYCRIEQKRHGVENEMYLYKVIGRGYSNSYVPVPVQTPEKEKIHNDGGPVSNVVPVLRCVCCGVAETTIHKFAVSDVVVIESDHNKPKSTKEFKKQCSIEFNPGRDYWEFKYCGELKFEHKSKFQCMIAQKQLQNELGL